MLRLKTKTEKQVPYGRGVTTAIVHLIIDELRVNRNNATGIGYYYYYNQSNEVVKLSEIKTVTEIPLFTEIETNLLAPLESSQNLFPNLKQRLKETTLMNIAQENGESYGITPQDLEDDI